MQKAHNRLGRFPHFRFRGYWFRPTSLSLCSLTFTLIVAPLPLPLAGAQKTQRKPAARRSGEAHRSDRDANPEQRTARAFEAARANPLDLRAFLVRMPKGADLHNHLSGAIYSESWIRAAREDGLCVDLATLSFRPADPPAAAAAPGPSTTAASIASTAAPATCGEGRVPAAQAYADQHLYDALIDAFSMRSFVPTPAVSGHDHFFDT